MQKVGKAVHTLDQAFQNFPHLICSVVAAHIKRSSPRFASVHR